MKPIRTIKVVGYNPDKRKSFNELFAQPVNPQCVISANEVFNQQEENSKFNNALTYL